MSTMPKPPFNAMREAQKGDLLNAVKIADDFAVRRSRESGTKWLSWTRTLSDIHRINDDRGQPPAPGSPEDT
jgi:hypothetical protein